MVQGKTTVRGAMLRAGVAGAALVMGLVMPAVALAQTAANYEIASQPLSQALMQLSRQANVDIVVPARLTRGKTAGAVSRAVSVDAALRQMLAGTGLSHRATGTGFVVQPGPVGNAGAASAQSAAQGGKGVITGTLRDEKTAAALKGARIEIEETGEITSTDDLGAFRFVGVPAGEVTLRISYLGYPERSETVVVLAGFANRAEVYLGSGAGGDIMVYGQVSARAQALNQERTAENSRTVISADLLGNFQGTTLSEALRRAPGVAFEQNNESGDGTNIIVRGLSSDYNKVKINGVVLPETTGQGRSANLGNILADTVSQITINKTLMANQDSAGTGGLVEIETKTPLDRPRRFFNASAETTRRGKGYGKDHLITGTASAKFGAAQNFGVSAAVQWRRQDNTSISYALFGSPGPYLPLGPNGQPAPLEDLDPRTPFPFEEGIDRFYVRQSSATRNRTQADTLTINLAAEWQVSPSTNLNLDYVRSSRTSDSFVALSSFASYVGYAPVPIASLGGEVRYALADQLFWGAETQQFQTTLGQKEITDTVSFRGETKTGRLSLGYKAGYAKGSTKTPFAASAYVPSAIIDFSDDALVLPGVFDPITGYRTTLYGPRVGRGFPTPLLTPAGLALADPINSARLSSASRDEGGTGSSANYALTASARYEFTASPLKYIEIGLDFNRFKARSRFAQSTYYEAVLDDQFRGPLATDLGIEFSDLGRASRGLVAARLASQKSAEAFLTHLPVSAAQNFTVEYPGAVDPLSGKEFTRESELAGYVQARIELGNLEVVAGARLSKFAVRSAFGNGVIYYDEFGNFDEAFYNASRVIVEGQGSQTAILPRGTLNFRPLENLVFRAGYFMSIARPQVQLLTTTQNVSLYSQPFYGPNNDRPYLEISTGNPDLKSARTHNLDFSAEYYFSNVGVLKFGAFYKRIDNLLESNAVGLANLDGIELPDDPRFDIANLPPNIFIRYTKPVNNPAPGTIWGAEISVERRLNFLPGILSGLGVYANYTFSKSTKSQPSSWFGAPVYDAAGNITDRIQIDYIEKVPFNSQPKHSGTFGLTYNKGAIDGSLFYTYQARRQSGIGSFGLDDYVEAADSLDLRLEYKPRIGVKEVRFFVEGSDLLRGRSTPATQLSLGGRNGAPVVITSGFYRGGRSFNLGASVSF